MFLMCWYFIFVVSDVLQLSNILLLFSSLLDRRVLPALGLTWSNQLLMRLMVCRTHICIEGKLPEGEVCASTTGTVIRRMEIIFAPHLPQSFCNYIINEQGVRGMKETGINRAETTLFSPCDNLL